MSVPSPLFNLAIGCWLFSGVGFADSSEIGEFREVSANLSNSLLFVLCYLLSVLCYLRCPLLQGFAVGAF